MLIPRHVIIIFFRWELSSKVQWSFSAVSMQMSARENSLHGIMWTWKQVEIVRRRWEKCSTRTSTCYRFLFLWPSRNSEKFLLLSCSLSLKLQHASVWCNSDACSWSRQLREVRTTLWGMLLCAVCMKETRIGPGRKCIIFPSNFEANERRESELNAACKCFSKRFYSISVRLLKGKFTTAKSLMLYPEKSSPVMQWETIVASFPFQHIHKTLMSMLEGICVSWSQLWWS